MLLSANNYTINRPLWIGDVDLPPSTTVSYTYMFQDTNGTFHYESGNRTLSTGACTNQTITKQDAYRGNSSVTSPSVVQIANDWGETHNFCEGITAPGNGTMLGLPGRNLTDPPYKINDAAGSISNLTIATNLIHANGLAEYDTHNLYGTMMSYASRNSMINRRPGLRPLIITRSTFAGAGAKVGHWLGDNTATWFDYRVSISQAIQFAAIYQLPMVGADVCGYAEDTTETLCARWAMLGAFYPFYRNHQSSGTLDHEFYRWPTVAEAAKVAIKARYQLLDYLYTALYQQTLDGTPTLNPMFFLYPEDPNTVDIALQYFFGPSLLISPVTNENIIDVVIYLPNDIFYDFFTYEPVRGTGSWVTLSDVNFTSIPVHIKGGSIIPIREDGANTTKALRTLNFNLLVAPGLNGTASGDLYLDDGVSLVQDSTSFINFTYDGHRLSMKGAFDYAMGDVQIASVFLLGGASPMMQKVNKSLTGPFSINLGTPYGNSTGIGASLPNSTAVPQWYGYGS